MTKKSKVKHAEDTDDSACCTTPQLNALEISVLL